jgi:hypothetical protein
MAVLVHGDCVFGFLVHAQKKGRASGTLILDSHLQSLTYLSDFLAS